MASIKSIPKFTGPNKSLKAISHVKALESLGATLPIKNFGGATATDFQLHWEDNDARFMLFQINSTSTTSLIVLYI